MSFADSIELVGKTLDVLGVIAIVLGVGYATFLAAFRSAGGIDRYRGYRQGIGRATLLGLEILVAADIVRTVAISPTSGVAVTVALAVLVKLTSSSRRGPLSRLANWINGAPNP